MPSNTWYNDHIADATKAVINIEGDDVQVTFERAARGALTLPMADVAARHREIVESHVDRRAYPKHLIRVLDAHGAMARGRGQGCTAARLTVTF